MLATLTTWTLTTWTLTTWLLLLPLPILQPDVSVSLTDSQQATIAFWNLENLFDFEDDPDNPGDDEFLPEKEWDEARYLRKLDHLARAIDSLDAQLLAVCEVENRRVLEDLISQPALAEQNWSIAHIDSPDHRGIDLALLFRQPFSLDGQATLHTIDLGGNASPTRGVLEVPVKAGGRPLTVLVNHWPSRYGGAEKSAPRRAAAAQTVRKITDQRLADDHDRDLIIVGDLNDDPWDDSVRRQLKAVRELRSVTHESNLKPGRDGKFSPRLWNPSWSFARGPDTGTYYYWNDWSWNCFDQVIVSPGMLDDAGIQLIQDSIQVHAPDFMRDSEQNARRPARFRQFRGRWEEGFSDHFPIKFDIHIESSEVEPETRD